MSKVRLNLLGTFTAVLNDTQDAALTAKKSQAVLAYLALASGNPVPREKLASLLWTDTAGEFARTNLRQSIAVIRKALDHENNQCLVNDGNSLLLNKSTVSNDVDQFERYLEQGTPDEIQLAIELYKGELLEGIGLDDCEFGEWLIVQRRRLQDKLTISAHSLLEHYRNTEQQELEVATANKLLSLDTHDETAHRSIMHAHSQSGRRHLALKQYELCKTGLQNELGAEPEPATTHLYKNILEQKQSTFSEVRSEEHSDAPPPTTSSNSTRFSLRWITAAVALLILAIAMRWQSNTGSAIALQEIPELEIAIKKNQNPTIAVLPFVNLSNDPSQNYFSDGLSEDLITDLSKISALNVIARASSFAYENKNPNIEAIATELGATFLLTGTVRREQSRIRLNVQLIDTKTGAQLWAERYDRNGSDFLKLQDELAQTVVSELSLSISQSEQKELERVLQVDTDAYDLFLKSLRPLRELTADGTDEARTILERVVDMDPNFARAQANLALTYNQEVIFGYSENPEESIKRGFALANKALDIDSSLPQLHFVLSGLHLATRSHDNAIKAARQSIALDPNYADGYGTLAQQLMFAGNLESAELALHKAKKLNPRFTFTYLWVEGQILLLSGKFEEALAVFEDINERNPSFISGYLLTISTLGHLDRAEDAEWTIAELETLVPEFDLHEEEKAVLYRLEGHKKIYLDGLRLAGLAR